MASLTYEFIEAIGPNLTQGAVNDPEGLYADAREFFGIETLEQAVLKTWWRQSSYATTCEHCSGTTQFDASMAAVHAHLEHKPGCIVPALIAKYEVV